MPSFVYPNENIESVETLHKALVNLGVDDAIISSNGDIVIETSIGTQLDADTAIAEATIGSLFASKQAKSKAVSERSAELLTLGVDDWSGEKVELTKNEADNYYTDFQYFTANPSKISASTPYVVFTTDGGISITTDINDLETLSQNAVDRLQYIYTASLNADGSKSDLALKVEIQSAPDMATLDAITDTRV